ncbi:MAG: M67 family metallopeptidase [Methylococcales bacterium]
MKEEVLFPRPLVNQLLHQAQISPQREICGLIGARHEIPVSIYPVKNIADLPALRFRMDPAEQIQAIRQIRENHEDLFAIYHSHPSAPAEPSLSDLEQVGYPDLLQIIISLNTKGVLEMRAFQYGARGVTGEVVIGLV